MTTHNKARLALRCDTQPSSALQVGRPSLRRYEACRVQNYSLIAPFCLLYLWQPLIVHGCEALYENRKCYSGDFSIEAIKACAESGDLESQVVLSEIYFAGFRDIRPDMMVSYHWARISAERGCPQSQRLMGHFYYYGLGTAPSTKRAVYWWEKAAGNNDIPALCQLGMMYSRGDYGEDLMEQGFKFMQNAMDLGATGQCKVNYAYAIFVGRGTDPDREKAIGIFDELAAEGNDAAIRFLESIQ